MSSSEKSIPASTNASVSATKSIVGRNRRESSPARSWRAARNSCSPCAAIVFKWGGDLIRDAVRVRPAHADDHPRRRSDGAADGGDGVVRLHGKQLQIENCQFSICNCFAFSFPVFIRLFAQLLRFRLHLL